MITIRRFPLRMVLGFAARVATQSVIWAAVVFAFYFFAGWTFLRVPFLPIATVGTAVAFYIGFKNSVVKPRFFRMLPP